MGNEHYEPDRPVKTITQKTGESIALLEVICHNEGGDILMASGYINLTGHVDGLREREEYSDSQANRVECESKSLRMHGKEQFVEENQQSRLEVPNRHSLQIIK